MQAFLAPLVAPVDAAQLPLTVAQRGSVYEAATALPHAQAAAALRASGKVLGVTCRPWLRGEESPVPSRMLWLTLPAASRAPLPELWKRLTEQPQLGTFGGLLEGDSAGRVGVRLFGTGPIASGIRELVGEALDAAIPPPRVIVRVGGYPIGFGLAFGNYQAIRGEIPKVFGEEAGNVRVVSCTHLTATGQERPKFDVTLEGVYEGWPGKTLAPADSRLLPKTWEVRGLTRVRHTYRAVGRTAQVRPPPPPTGRGASWGGWGQWCGRAHGGGGWGGRRMPRCGPTREGRPAVGYSLTLPMAWAREGRPAAVGCSLTRPVTWAREGRPAVGHSLDPPPPLWLGLGRDDLLL